MLLYVLGVVLIVIGLALSIGLHEIGHLVPAKKFGVKVGQYMIGFGPTLWSRKFGETEYGIKAIPLGGYISMAGMYPPAKPGAKPRTASTGFLDTLVQDARTQSADSVKPGDENRVFYKLAFWKRIIIMLGGPSMNLLIAIVVYGIILCGIGVNQYSTTIDSVSQCVLPASSTATKCADSDPVAPAAAAGVKPGDKMISVDGVAVTTWEQATSVIRKSAGQTIDLVVERKGTQLTLQLTPLLTSRPVVDATGKQVTNADGTAKTEKVGFIGIGPSVVHVPQPVTAVLPTVGDNIGHDFVIIGTFPQRLVQVAQAAFGGEKRDPNGPIGVVGVGRLAGEATSLTSAPVADRAALVLSIIASLNVALFVFNMIPLLPLDGGHVAGALWEALRRRIAKWFKRPDPGPVDIAKLIPLTLTIVTILGASSLLLIYADIVNPVHLF